MKNATPAEERAPLPSEPFRDEKEPELSPRGGRYLDLIIPARSGVRSCVSAGRTCSPETWASVLRGIARPASSHHRQSSRGF
jgi:hypothetical protein